jgi:hypothetical protein
MVSSDATTVEAYLASLPADRHKLVDAIRETVNAHLPTGYEEGMLWGMIGWYVPLCRYPAGYHTQPDQPLPLAALAPQKQYVSFYLMGTYCGCAEPGTALTADSEWFRTAWLATGKKLNMGVSCVRVKKVDDVAFDVVGAAIEPLPVDVYVRRYESVRPAPKSKRTKTKS